MHSIVGKQAYTLQSVPPDISSTQLATYRVITILLTIIPLVIPMAVLQLPVCTSQSLHLSTWSSNSLPLGQPVSLSQFCLLIYIQ